MYELLVMLVFPAAMVYAAASDLFTMTISNWVSVILVSVFVVLALWSGMDVTILSLHLAAGLSMLAIGFVLFAFGFIGGGDAKLFAATAVWLGWSNLFAYAFLASLFGGVLTIAIIVARRVLAPEFCSRAEWTARLHRADSGVPYGIALGVAGLLMYPQTGLMISLP